MLSPHVVLGKEHFPHTRRQLQPQGLWLCEILMLIRCLFTNEAASNNIHGVSAMRIDNKLHTLLAQTEYTDSTVMFPLSVNRLVCCIIFATHLFSLCFTIKFGKTIGKNCYNTGMRNTPFSASDETLFNRHE